MRTIKISFEGCPIKAPNSNSASDVITLSLDFAFSGGNVIIAGIVLEGTQDAINAINDTNPLLVNGEDKVEIINNSAGNVTVTHDFDGPVNLYPTIYIQSYLTDHLGWNEATPSKHPTNYIVDNIQNPIITHTGEAFVFIK